MAQAGVANLLLTLQSTAKHRRFSRVFTVGALIGAALVAGLGALL